MKQLKRLENAMLDGTKLKNLVIEFGFRRNYNYHSGSKFDYQPRDGNVGK
jgi:hypothetical protein